MTAIVQRAPKAVVADVFEDMKPTIDRIAARFAKRFGQDFEECRDIAYFHFIEVYHGFDPTRGTRIEQRLNVILWNRLLDGFRNDIRRSKYMKRADVDLEFLDHTDPEPFDQDDFCTELTEDARTVVSLLFDTPRELLDMIQQENPSFENPGAPVRRCLFRYSNSVLGWAASRVRNAFRELEESLT